MRVLVGDSDTSEGVRVMCDGVNTGPPELDTGPSEL